MVRELQILMQKDERGDSRPLAVSPDASADPLERTVPPVPEIYEHLCNTIHDDVLQSIGVSILQVDLLRQLWASGREIEASDELENLVQTLLAAVDALRSVMDDLRLAALGHPDPPAFGPSA